jgi:hypothetical protein
MSEYHRGYEDGLDLAVAEACAKCQEKLRPILESLRERRRSFQKGRLALKPEE